MEIIRQGGLPPGGPGTALALGYFDGIHIGHQEVIGAARREAGDRGLRLAVFTFGGGSPVKGQKSIQSPEQKHDVLVALGVDVCFEPSFESFRHLAPRAFFDEWLAGAYGARAMACGDNFGFGAGRAGNTRLLREWCKEKDISLSVLPMALYKGQPVSSSRIRGALAEGTIEDVNAMLGRPYEIDFPVGKGQQFGRAHGFPTINQRFPEGMQAPAYGVYITAAEVEGKAYASATGYGTRPTLNGQDATCETFILGYDGDLYGKRVQVRFYEKIDETQKFEGPEALAAAVQAWAGQARRYFEQNKGLLRSRFSV